MCPHHFFFWTWEAPAPVRWHPWLLPIQSQLLPTSISMLLLWKPNKSFTSNSKPKQLKVDTVGPAKLLQKNCETLIHFFFFINSINNHNAMYKVKELKTLLFTYLVVILLRRSLLYCQAGVPDPLKWNRNIEKLWNSCDNIF